MNNESGVWIVVPAYNERAVIADVLTELTSLGHSVVVVDDGSSDDTFERVATFPVVTLRHVCNLGQGAALQTGIAYALSRRAEFIVTFDADGQHKPGDISRVLAPLQAGTHDAVLGSRFVAAGAAVDIPRSKRLLLRCGVLFTRAVTGLTITDTHNGLRGFTARAAARIVISQNGMAHASEILAEVARLQLRMCEVPVTVAYTAYSLSKGQAVSNAVNILWDIASSRIR